MRYTLQLFFIIDVPGSITGSLALYFVFFKNRPFLAFLFPTAHYP